MTAPLIAIDFGTARTKAAYFDEQVGEPRLVELGGEGCTTVPSLFYLPKNGGEILVGDAAQAMEKTDPDGIFRDLKKEMVNPDEILIGPDRIAPKRIELAARLFRHLRDHCQAKICAGTTITDCCLTVPGIAPDPYRHALHEAAKLAGFSNVAIIEEPVAAAQWWLAAGNGQDNPGRVLVCDVGGDAAGFGLAMLKHTDDDRQPFHVEESTDIESGDHDIAAMVNRLVARTRGFARKCAGAKKLPMLLTGGGANLSGLKQELEKLENIDSVQVWKDSEFATVLGAATPVAHVILRHRIRKDLAEIEQAERELLDPDYVLSRLAPTRGADWKRAAELAWPEGKWLVGLCHFEKVPGWERDKVLAARYFRESAAGAFSKAQVSLAVCYREGEGVPYDPAMAVRLLQAAMDVGDDIAPILLAIHYLNGWGVPVDQSKCVQILRQSVSRGSTITRWLLGRLCMEGKGCKRDEVEAMHHFKSAMEVTNEAARKGGKSAQWLLGLSYLSGFGVGVNLKLAIEWLSKSAEQGISEAQGTLADCYGDGIGVPADPRKAADLYKLAAEQGNSSAQAKYGIYLLHGLAGTLDPNAAFEWFRKSAERGDPDGQHQLGLCFMDGIGVQENQNDGFRWLKRAAEQGHAQAQNDLGHCLLNGIGAPADPISAVKWLRKSADQDCPDALCELALCCRWGTGMEQDIEQALSLLHKAAEAGHPESMLRYGLLLSEFGPENDNGAEAVSWFRRAAEQNHPGAIFRIGICHFEGDGVLKDEKAGFWHVQRAAEMGSSDAQTFVGDWWLREQNYGEAFTWFKRSADQGNSEGKIGLAKCYLNGWGASRDVREAAKILQPLADANWPEAMTLLGKCYQTGLL